MERGGGNLGKNHSFASVGRLGGLLIGRGSAPVPESPMDDWVRIALAMWAASFWR